MVDIRRNGWKTGYIMSSCKVGGFGENMLLRIEIEIEILCLSVAVNHVWQNTASPRSFCFSLSKMVEDIRAARIKKLNAEFLKGIGSIYTVLGAF